MGSNRDTPVFSKEKQGIQLHVLPFVIRYLPVHPHRWERRGFDKHRLKIINKVCTLQMKGRSEYDTTATRSKKESLLDFGRNEYFVV